MRIKFGRGGRRQRKRRDALRRRAEVARARVSGQVLSWQAEVFRRIDEGVAERARRRV